MGSHPARATWSRVANPQRSKPDLPPESGVAAEKLPLDIVHQDAAVIVINKPPGLVVHPGAGNRAHTLQNALLAHDAKLKHVPRAGLVHRIDKDTSGLFVVARTLEAHTALVAELAAHEIEREYLAVCTGAMTGGGTVDEPIGRHRTQRTKMTVRSDGREAVTHYRIEQRFRAHTLTRVQLETGPHAPDPRASRRTWGIPSWATRSTAVAASCPPALPLHSFARWRLFLARRCTRRVSHSRTRKRANA